jgi:hypothetical protein
VKDWNLIVMTKTVDQMKILLLVKSVEELKMAVVEMASLGQISDAGVFVLVSSHDEAC